ncbi:uncharacterized protein [Cicer arietinum]|uniref:uncharacterized protein isoform X2 n=1 Tax=Cicer arietinum TaxID=3827 RepID=UPI003CC55715
MECTKYVEKYNDMINSQRVYIFLAGLDSHLDGVRGRILATTPLPNVQSIYATVCAEANRQDVMLSGEYSNRSAFVVKKYPNKKICKSNHVMETCFKLHGYPEWHPKGKTTSNNKIETSKVHLSIVIGFVTKSGGNEREVQHHDDSMFDLFCEDRLSCENHSAGSFIKS